MKSEKKISIVIVDDHTIFRTGLRMLLESQPNLKILDDCGTIADAAISIATKKPDIILLDLNLDGEDGAALISQMPIISSKTNVLILTGKKDTMLHYNCLKLGANGLVLKENTSEMLFEAIASVHAGELWFDRSIMGKMLLELARPHNNSNGSNGADKSNSLTNREREVITLVAEGLKNKAIAERLFISETTVRHHLTSIFNKLEIDGRLELVIYAFKHDLAKVPH